MEFYWKYLEQSMTVISFSFRFWSRFMSSTAQLCLPSLHHCLYRLYSSLRGHNSVSPTLFSSLGHDVWIISLSDMSARTYLWYVHLLCIIPIHSHPEKLDSHCEAPASIPGDFMWDSWCITGTGVSFSLNLLGLHSTIVPYSSITVPWGVRWPWPGGTLSHCRSSIWGFIPHPVLGWSNKVPYW